MYNYNDEIDYINQMKNSIQAKTTEVINRAKQNLNTICDSITLNVNQILDGAKRDCQLLSSNIYNNLLRVIEKKKTILDQISIKIDKSNPLKLLKSGYTKTYYNGEVLQSVSSIKEGDQLKTILQDGVVISKIERVEVK